MQVYWLCSANNLGGGTLPLFLFLGILLHFFLFPDRSLFRIRSFESQLRTLCKGLCFFLSIHVLKRKSKLASLIEYRVYRNLTTILLNQITADGKSESDTIPI